MDNIVALKFADELKVQGINFKGYGILPKYVMIDPDLSIEEKCMYAYFCSYAGSGNTTFPSRAKIIADLQICKDTYYKYLNSIIVQGYISVEHKSGGKGTGYRRNIYTIMANPKKFKDMANDEKRFLSYTRIRTSGLNAAGYGFIPKAVMLDSRLPLKAKAIYAYLCSFTGVADSAFPKKDVICFHLGISESTYYRFYKLLPKLNYITVIQRHIYGRFSVNDYYLNQMPDENNPSPKTIKKVTLPATENQDIQNQDIQNQDIQNQDIQNQDIQNQDIQNQDIIINSSGSNNTGRNNPSIYQGEPDEMDRLSDDDDMEKIRVELLDAGTLPVAYLYEKNSNRLAAAIRILYGIKRSRDYDDYDDDDYDKSMENYESSIQNLFIEALTEMLRHQEKPMRLKGLPVSYKDVYSRLKMYICTTSGTYGNVFISMTYLPDIAISNFKRGCTLSQVKDTLKYMQACIWNAMQTGGSESLANEIYNDNAGSCF